MVELFPSPKFQFHADILPEETDDPSEKLKLLPVRHWLELLIVNSATGMDDVATCILLLYSLVSLPR